MKKIKHELLHLALGVCVFLAGVIFKALHDEHHKNKGGQV